MYLVIAAALCVWRSCLAAPHILHLDIRLFFFFLVLLYHLFFMAFTHVGFVCWLADCSVAFALREVMGMKMGNGYEISEVASRLFGLLYLISIAIIKVVVNGEKASRK